MNVPMMSWNTQLFVMGNKLSKYRKKDKIDNCKVDSIFNIVEEFLKKENAIAILQEIPYKTKVNGEWFFHYIYNEFIKKFKDYGILYYEDKDGFQIKMTVVITKKANYIHKSNNKINKDKYVANRFVAFEITDVPFNFLGVHAHDSFDIRGELSRNKYYPHIMIGDFNSGNYRKNNENKDFSSNRQSYLLLSEGYFDLIQGEYTTTYKTQIDHVLMENSLDLREKCRFSNVKVDRTIKESDHYPIFFDLDFDI